MKNEKKPKLKKNQKYSKEILIEIALKNKEHFTTTLEWNKFAKENKLPQATTYYTYFGPWSECFYEIFGIKKPKRKKYTKAVLSKIALAHKKHFTTTTAWNKHAKENRLPRSTTFSLKYGSWGESLNEILGVNNSDRKKSYPKEELKLIALTNKEFFTTSSTWNRFAKDNDLPRASTFCRAFGSWTNLVEDLTDNYSNAKNGASRDKLRKIALKYPNYFLTANEWDAFAIENNLPSANSYISAFGSWKESLRAIMGKYEDPKVRCLEDDE
ncbi:hypothetical protein ACQKFO_21710 [Rossellomorea sp. NPDC071047]|uniref:hypothetical protein n=1 Tax=Rossellomorea sp. NPDC071047 TaxID=3390675 RepID=UPI003D0756A4